MTKQRFTCNVCGTACEWPGGPPGRETVSCNGCRSTVRLRAIAALLSRELFGIDLALPQFPELRGVRGLGMSDPPSLAEQMATKFDYLNTFYDRAPSLDVMNPEESDLGRYDFIVSSEVMEHVPGPIEVAFRNLYHLLKPNGFLLVTVPYSLEPETKEHFPELNEYTLAALGNQTVLVNRRKNGQIDVFEDLRFHLGGGATLEMRLFSERSVRALLEGAGFVDVRIAAESFPGFGVEHGESWSLPMVAHKGRYSLPVAEVARAYAAAAGRAERLEHEVGVLRSALGKLESGAWTRVGKKIGALS